MLSQWDAIKSRLTSQRLLFSSARSLSELGAQEIEEAIAPQAGATMLRTSLKHDEIVRGGRQREDIYSAMISEVGHRREGVRIDRTAEMIGSILTRNRSDLAGVPRVYHVRHKVLFDRPHMPHIAVCERSKKNPRTKTR
jgi:hypothetical protein